MTIMTAIMATLDKHLSKLPDVPKLAFQNVPYKVVVGTPHIKVNFTPTSRRLATMGDTPQQRYQGLYNLLVCVPEAEGPGVGLAIADDLLGHFQASRDITYNGQYVTIEYSEVGNGFLDSAFYCIPVTVAWYTYHT